MRHRRTALGFTQEDFARHVGIDRGYMGGVERGEHNLTFRKLMVVLKGLRARPDEFFRDIRLGDREADDVRAPPQDRHVRRALAKAAATYSEMLGIAVLWERERAGFTQEKFAYHAGLARSYMSGIERGERNPTFTQLMRILEGLGIEPSEFFQHFPSLPIRRAQREPNC